MRDLAAQNVVKFEGFLGGLLTFHADAHQVLGRQDDSVAPLNVFAVSCAADKANIAAHNFRENVGYEVFFESVRIGRDWRLFLHSHCSKSPDRLPHEALGKDGTSAACRTLKNRVADNIHSCVASCSTSEQSARNRAYRFSKSIADSFSTLMRGAYV